MSRHASTMSSGPLTLLAVAFSLGAGGAASAAIYTVGTDAACTSASIAEAVAAAQAHPGDNGDAIEVAENRDRTPEANTIAIALALGKHLDIRGGFANCSQTFSDGSHAVIDGAGGSSGPVFRITANTTARVTLYNLTIQGGDTPGSDKGGGIYFTGSGDGTLTLDHCTVQQNTAGYGGGIYADGPNLDSSQGNLMLGRDVAVVGNSARFDGGGIAADGTTFSLLQDDSYIADNHAPNGYGGGLLIWAGRKPTIAYVGSTGFGNLGPVYANGASRGGGIAVMGTDALLAQLNLYSTSLTRPVRIRSNTASADGGGIYLGRAGGAFGRSTLRADEAYIEDNVAPHGAAISVRESAGAGTGVFFNAPSGQNGCPVGAPCGGISGNAAIDGAAQAVGGIVEASSDAIVRFYRTAFRGNTGKFVYFGNDRTDFDAYHVLIAGNNVSGNLIAADSVSDYADIENATITDNTIGADVVLRLRSNASFPSKLYRSIVWQQYKTILQLSGDPLDVIDDLLSEGNSVGGGTSPEVIVQFPRFVDPAHGDYSLRAGSHAVDYATTVTADSLDLYSNPRDIDLPVVGNVHGRRDLGAIERQAL